MGKASKVLPLAKRKLLAESFITPPACNSPGETHYSATAHWFTKDYVNSMHPATAEASLDEQLDGKQRNTNFPAFYQDYQLRSYND